MGELGGIAVNEYMQTSDPDIYAVGDCIEVTNRITGKKVLAPYGDLANLEGRIAARNIIEDNTVAYPGTIQTGVCKVFEYIAGSTGLSESNARKLGFDVECVLTSGLDKPHFMGAKLLVIKMVADKKTGRLLGMQAVGPGDVSKRIAEAAMAIQGGLTVSDICNADLPYAPPFSPAIDNFIMTAHCLENKMLGYMTGISSTEFKEKLERREPVYVLDTRSPDEYEQMRLGVGEVLIPLGALRNRLDDLPKDKNTEIITYCKTSCVPTNLYCPCRFRLDQHQSTRRRHHGMALCPGKMTPAVSFQCWKTGFQFFQSLETFFSSFPIIGKFKTTVFQSLESTFFGE